MPTVSNDQFRGYLQKFHQVYLSKLADWVPPQYRGNLLRNGHLGKATISGYVSTTYGIAYEYRPGTPGVIEVLSGSRRADSVLFRCSRKQIEKDGNIGIQLTGREFTIVNCAFDGRLPLRLDGAEASATIIDVDWTFGGKAEKVGFAQIFADRTSDRWSAESAVQNAMEEVLRATVDVAGMERLRTSVGDYLQRFKQGHVLVLGDYSGEGGERLARIKAALGDLGYFGFTLQEVPEAAGYDLRQKLTAVAPVCRFVVVDDSSRGGQAAELPIIEMLRVTSIVLRLHGADCTFVTRALDATSKVIKEWEYDTNDLETVLCEAVRWAESTIGDLERRFTQAYPWRAVQG